MRQDVANLRDSYYDAYDAYDANVRGSACHASHSASDHHGGCSRTGEILMLKIGEFHFHDWLKRMKLVAGLKHTEESTS